MAKANLFLIGAMKSGSTTLHDYLAQHPQIFMSEEKEPGFFVPELWGRRDDSEYSALFARAREERYIGESSTHYTKLPRFQGVVERIKDYNSNAKFIYIMRNPIERTISHYFHSVRNLKGAGETRDIFSAIKEDPNYIAYSDYAYQLAPYYAAFGKESVYTLVFEEFKEDVFSGLSQLYQWLDVDMVEPKENLVSNKAPEVYVKAKGKGYLNKLRHSEVWDKVSPLIPKALKKFGNQLSEEVSAEKLSSQERDEVYKLLTPIFKEKLLELEKVTGRDYSIWSL
ncbi:sulfotransferase family protein [Hahella sp. HN01]|uniref:sulfotransferase family protein n=1 Tax=unclassified Hahella TaxID=2624107 RepID=UPI001C1ED138|nr:sulfotransferase [Hahella sp. HN01]MBU6950602.1 sulfotransferase [Hahella sp. HN01]